MRNISANRVVQKESEKKNKVSEIIRLMKRGKAKCFCHQMALKIGSHFRPKTFIKLQPRKLKGQNCTEAK
jgi:hypothetical protein